MEEFSDFEELLTKSMPMLRTIASSFPERHREDLIQEGILGLHSAYSSFDPSIGVPFKTYIRICVKNSMLTAYKKLRKDDLSETFDETAFVDNTSSLEDGVISRNDAETFFSGFKKSLSLLERNVLLEYLKDKSYDEIAETLKIPVKAVDNALMRIKKKVRNFIRK